MAAWGQDKRTNKQQVFVMLITGCREVQGSGGTTLSFMAPRDNVAQGSSRTGCGHDPARLHVQYRLGTVGSVDPVGPVGSWAGRKGNKYLSPAFGRKPDEAFLSQGRNTFYSNSNSGGCQTTVA